MNRKQRRSAPKPSAPAAGVRTDADPAAALFAEAARCQRQNQLADAVRLYKRLLAIKPDHAEASNNLGLVFLAQGKLADASARFAKALALRPQLLSPFEGVLNTLVAVLPTIGVAMRNAAAVWPKLLPLNQLLAGAGLSAIAADPLLIHILEATPVRDIALECALTCLRAALLDATVASAATGDEITSAFCTAMAKQGFINEFVFAVTPSEQGQIEKLTTALADALAAGTPVPPIWVTAIAMYRPLNALPFADALLAGRWPPAVDAVLTQQLREPRQEHELRNTIPCLTPIEDETSQRVRDQYEQNPYPRWVDIAAGVEPVSLQENLRAIFPGADFSSMGKSGPLEFLVAGCGTGWHAIATAQKYRDARLLAVDLSLSSLCYAKRKTPASLAERLTYAQADILKLAGIGRSFDIIDASGVLHHMADPPEGWRILLSLLRPGGLMHLGLYSDLARRDIVAARTFIAERGFPATPEGIRQSRQALLQTPLRSLTHFADFFSASECRDMLFHVQEKRTTIPAIKSFLEEQQLKFIGFEFSPAALQKYRAVFSDVGRPMTDIDHWHRLEMQTPDMFEGMYNFWVQKK
jgi:SAM-dependent methyltransferase/tetratricopeptide (TPR) repeat protein